MTAALIRTHPADGAQLDLPLTPVEFMHWVTTAAGVFMAVVAVTCTAFAEPYELAVPADQIEVLS